MAIQRASRRKKVPRAVVFTARIYKLGINPCVEVPARVSRAFRRQGYVPVIGSVEGEAYRATLVPVGGFRHRLFFNTDIRTRAAVGPGDRVRVVLMRDRQARELPVPAALTAALKQNPRARAAFHALAASRRKEILAYLNWFKTSEAMARNVQKVMALLTGGKRSRRCGAKR